MTTVEIANKYISKCCQASVLVTPEHHDYICGKCKEKCVALVSLSVKEGE